MIMAFWMWWRGYITVRLRGPGLERLLNKMASARIELRGVERLTPEVLLVRLQIADFSRLRPLLWETRINVSILDRHGLPFILESLKSRVFFAAGLVSCLLFILYLSGFIWFVELSGYQSLSLGELKFAIDELGLRSGVARRFIAPRQIERELLLRFPALAWAQVELKGVKAQVSLAERSQAEGLLGAGHIYAREDGVITQILVLRGTPQVGKGDTVQAGEILISGVYYDGRGVKQFGAAEGIVKARVWYQAVGEAPLLIWEPEKTGREHRRFLLTIGPWTLPLGRGYSEETHLKEQKSWCLTLGASMAPLSWTRVNYSEVKYVPKPVSRSEAEAAASELAWESLARRGVQRDELRQEKKEVHLMSDQEGLRVTLLVEVEAEIGVFLNQ